MHNHIVRLLDFVPLAGPWVAGIVSCVMALLKSPVRAFYVEHVIER